MKPSNCWDTLLGLYTTMQEKSLHDGLKNYKIEAISSQDPKSIDMGKVQRLERLLVHSSEWKWWLCLRNRMLYCFSRKTEKEYIMEIWKDVKGFEGIYSVSNKGRVKSLKRKNVVKDRIIKLRERVYNHTSYYDLTLSSTKSGKVTKLVHRLVAEAFLEPVADKKDVNHIDNNGLNNDVENLEWTNKKLNYEHSRKQGRSTLSGSVGGKANAIRSKIRARFNLNMMIGQQQGSLLFIKPVIREDSKKEKYSLKTKCLRCGSTQISSTLNLRSKNLRMCKSCSIKKTNRLKKFLKHKDIV